MAKKPAVRDSRTAGVERMVKIDIFRLWKIPPAGRPFGWMAMGKWRLLYNDASALREPRGRNRVILSIETDMVLPAGPMCRRENTATNETGGRPMGRTAARFTQ